MAQAQMVAQKASVDMVTAIFNKISSLENSMTAQTTKINSLDISIRNQSQSISDMQRQITDMKKSIEDLSNQREKDSRTVKHESYFKGFHDLLHPDFS